MKLLLIYCNVRTGTLSLYIIELKTMLMNAKVLYIKQPSHGLLNLVRKLQAEKEAKIEALVATSKNENLTKHK